MTVRLVIGADHAGFGLKRELVTFSVELGQEVEDVGTHDETPVDYPDFAETIGLALREARAERGVLICGSGVGAAVAANKLPGIRAGLCHDTYSARQGVEHDDMNVLALGARVIGPELAGAAACLPERTFHRRGAAPSQVVKGRCAGSALRRGDQRFGPGSAVNQTHVSRHLTT